MERQKNNEEFKKLALAKAGQPVKKSVSQVSNQLTSTYAQRVNQTTSYEQGGVLGSELFLSLSPSSFLSDIIYLISKSELSIRIVRAPLYFLPK